MANAGTSAYGGTLAVTDGTNTTTVTQITKIGLGPGGVTDIDISTMDGANKWKEFIPGMIEAGEFNCDVNFEDGQETTLLALVGVTGRTWTMQFNDGTTQAKSSKFACLGYLKPFGFDGPMDSNPITQSLTIKLSGLPTVTGITA
jgi:hypothetical protein